MSKPTKFFITHSWNDSEFAKRLGRDLYASGLDGFVDIYSIKPGDNIAERISKGIETCDIYLPVMSYTTLESPWCLEEINAAITLSNQRSRRGRPRIVPILVENIGRSIPPLLQSRLFIDFTSSYHSALWELLEMVFGIDPKVCIYRKNMFSGPRIQTGVEEGDEVWWGAYEVLEFSEKDNGMTLRVSADSQGNELSIEIWQGGLNIRDISSWMKNRVEIKRTLRGRNPELMWRIVAGVYTLYFVDHVRLIHRLSNVIKEYSYLPHPDYYPIRDYEVLYRIEVL